MRARVVKIGNSKGIRIPKPLLDQTVIMNDVELEVEEYKIIIRPIISHRVSWENAFKAMPEDGYDKLEIEDDKVSHSWDEKNRKGVRSTLDGLVKSPTSALCCIL